MVFVVFSFLGFVGLGYENDMKVPVTKVKMTEMASESAGTQLLDCEYR